jgi:outer membrane protein assembly factor BamB
LGVPLGKAYPDLCPLLPKSTPYQICSPWPHSGGIYNTNTRQSPFLGSQTGNLKWYFKTNDSFSAVNTPAISSDGTIYLNCYDFYLYAINPNGSLKWKYYVGDVVRSSTAIGADGTIYVGSDNNYLYAINSDGTLKWKYLTGGIIYSSPAIGSDGTVYFGCLDKNFYAINSDGTLKWYYTANGTIYSSPSIGTD